MLNFRFTLPAIAAMLRIVWAQSIGYQAGIETGSQPGKQPLARHGDWHITLSSIRALTIDRN
jgi:hypothetical protein